MRIVILSSLLLLVFSASVRAAEFKGITMGLVSTSWNTQLPPAVARQAEFFKEEGLEVRTVTIASGGPIMMASFPAERLRLSGRPFFRRGINFCRRFWLR